MIVGGIIGMIAAIGAPTLYQMFHRKGMAKLVAEMTDLCTQARTRAILTGDKTRILFFPQERRCVLEGGAVPGAVRLGGNASTEVVFEDSITLSALMIGMIKYDFKDDEVAWVWFYPNGTSDEMSLVVHSDKNEWRVFNLETATGMVTVETDMNKYL
jgi:Tfp pilus assembly protein FimT